MSKSNILELARKLVAAIEKEDQKNKVMLKDIPVGGKFDTGIGRFIVLEQKEDCTVVITERYCRLFLPRPVHNVAESYID